MCRSATNAAIYASNATASITLKARQKAKCVRGIVLDFPRVGSELVPVRINRIAPAGKAVGGGFAQSAAGHAPVHHSTILRLCLRTSCTGGCAQSFSEHWSSLPCRNTEGSSEADVRVGTYEELTALSAPLAGYPGE